MMRVPGLSLFSRDSGGSLILMSWHNPRRTCWGWSVSWERYPGDEGRYWLHITRWPSASQPSVSVHLYRMRRLRITWQPWALGRTVEPYVLRASKQSSLG